MSTKPIFLLQEEHVYPRVFSTFDLLWTFIEIQMTRYEKENCFKYKNSCHLQLETDQRSEIWTGQIKYNIFKLKLNQIK